MSGGYGGDAMDGGDHGPRARTGLRGFYLIAGSALAIGATAALILTDNPRLLKVAVIVAVWACVLALLAGARPPRIDNDEELTSEREAELRHTFELELDREVAARREYELRLEVAMRRELENTLRQDIGELRSQLGSLRQELTDRWNGELRLERFALRAESTRVSGSERQMLEHEAQRLSLEGGPTPDSGGYGVAQIEHGTSTYRSIRTTTVGGVTTEASTEHHEYMSGESPVASREIGPSRAPREVESAAARPREIESGPAGRARGQERPASGRPPTGGGARGEAVETASGRYPSPFPTAGEHGSARATRPTAGAGASAGAGAAGRAATSDPLFDPLPAEPAGSRSDGGPDRSAWDPARDDTPAGRWSQFGEPGGSDDSWNGADPRSRRRRRAADDDQPAADARRTGDSSAWGPSSFRVNGLDHVNGGSIPLPGNGIGAAGSRTAPGGNAIAAGGASPGPASGHNSNGGTPSWGSAATSEPVSSNPSNPASSSPAPPSPAPSNPASSGPAGGWAGLAERDASGRHGRPESYGDDSATMRRRRRYREDNEENDVLTRMRQQR